MTLDENATRNRADFRPAEKTKKKEKEGTGGIFVDSFCSFTDRASSVMASMVVGLREGVLCWSERGGVGGGGGRGGRSFGFGFGFGFGCGFGLVWFRFRFRFRSLLLLLLFPPSLPSSPLFSSFPFPPSLSSPPSLPLSSPSSLPLQLLVPVSRCLTQRSGLTVTSTCLSSSHF